MTPPYLLLPEGQLGVWLWCSSSRDEPRQLLQPLQADARPGHKQGLLLLLLQLLAGWGAAAVGRLLLLVVLQQECVG